VLGAGGWWCSCCLIFQHPNNADQGYQVFKRRTWPFVAGVPDAGLSVSSAAVSVSTDDELEAANTVNNLLILCGSIFVKSSERQIKVAGLRMNNGQHRWERCGPHPALDPCQWARSSRLRTPGALPRSGS